MEFLQAMRRDGYPIRAAQDAVRSVVDHARAVRLRVSCRDESRGVRAIARYTAHVTRRALVRAPSHASLVAQAELLASLLLDVEAAP